MDPLPLTLRELLDMARGHAKEAWQHTSAMMALIANANRSAKTRPYSASHFNPFAKATGTGEPLTVETLDSVRESIRKRKGRE